MNALVTFLQSPAAERIAWVLMHSLWQFALVAGVYAIVGQILRNRSAASRYLAVCTAMGCMVLVLPVTALFVKVHTPVAPVIIKHHQSMPAAATPPVTDTTSVARAEPTPAPA